jgi:FkbM family methyltransferase
VFRPETDDDRFVIPEVLDQDMYRMSTLVSVLSGVRGMILDCGAHIGVSAVMFASHFEGVPIVAYEPDLENFALLVENVKAYPSVVPVPYAVGNDEGGAMLWAQDGTGRHSMRPWLSGTKGQLVPMRALADEIRSHAPVLILKLDLEGLESELLNALPVDVLTLVSMLIVETHPWTGSPLDTRRLEASGFKVLFHPYEDVRHIVYVRRAQ